MAKSSTNNKQRKRKSNKAAFDNEEDYKRFAEKRNAATKKCRQKEREERKILREENALLRRELVLLRVEGGLGDPGAGGEGAHLRVGEGEVAAPRPQLEGAGVAGAQLRPRHSSGSLLLARPRRCVSCTGCAPPAARPPCSSAG